LTSVVLISLFSVMGLSDFVPVQSFGLFMSLTVFVAWLMDLFLLPVLLKMFNQYFPQDDVQTEVEEDAISAQTAQVTGQVTSDSRS